MQAFGKAGGILLDAPGDHVGFSLLWNTVCDKPHWAKQWRTFVEPASERIRVVIAKVGLDGHDRGVKIVARTLRDAGMEVIYTGLHRTPEEVVDAAVQEDADVIGVSILSGAHMTVFPRILDALRARDADDILVVGGGVIPDADVEKLKAIGVRELMLQDTPPEAIVGMVRRVVAERGPR